METKKGGHSGKGRDSLRERWGAHIGPPESAPLAHRRPKKRAPLEAGEKEWLTSVHETPPLAAHWMAPSRIEAP